MTGTVRQRGDRGSLCRDRLVHSVSVRGSADKPDGESSWPSWPYAVFRCLLDTFHTASRGQRRFLFDTASKRGTSSFLLSLKT